MRIFIVRTLNGVTNDEVMIFPFLFAFWTNDVRNVFVCEWGMRMKRWAVFWGILLLLISVHFFLCCSVWWNKNNNHVTWLAYFVLLWAKIEIQICHIYQFEVLMWSQVEIWIYWYKYQEYWCLLSLAYFWGRENQLEKIISIHPPLRAAVIILFI